MNTLSKRILAGTAAGLAGAIAMKAAVGLWHSVTKYEPTEGVFGLDDEADIRGAQLAARMVFNAQLPESDAKTIGVILHYGYGAATGVAYALASARTSAIRKGTGTLFGGALWLVGDELAVTLSGISDPRSKTPLSHVSALFAHLLFGAVMDSVIAGWPSCRRDGL
jgi:uncharacterized protein DUF1440